MCKPATLVLVLTNGYLYPYPKRLSKVAHTRHQNNAPFNNLVIEGVTHFEFLHTLTVEFASHAEMAAAQAITGWEEVGYDLLEGKYSAANGFAGKAPAIIAGKLAYCGFQIMTPTHRFAEAYRDAQAKQCAVFRINQKGELTP